MNQANIIAFYSKPSQKEECKYEIITEDRTSLFSELRLSTKKNNQKFMILSTQPIIYCVLGFCCFIMALSNLPVGDRIYFFYDDPFSQNIGLIVCMCALCILGVIITEIIKRAYTNKQIGQVPFLTKKQHKLNFNPTICFAGQVAHLLLLIEIILQTMPNQLFQHETLMDLSFLLNLVYFTYASSFLEQQKAKQMHYVPYLFYISTALACIIFCNIRVLCQNNTMKLHYTRIWKAQTERVILTYLGIVLQGIQFQLFRPAIQELERNYNNYTEVL